MLFYSYAYVLRSLVWEGGVSSSRVCEVGPVDIFGGNPTLRRCLMEFAGGKGLDLGTYLLIECRGVRSVECVDGWYS